MLGRILSAACCLVPLTAGCAGHLSPEAKVRHLFHSGRLADATGLLETSLESRPADAEPRQLDVAIVQLFSGQPQQAERTLRAVREKLAERTAPALGDTARVLLDDDLRGAYRGDTHEQLMLDGLLVLANLLHDGGDAYAYCLQLQARQRELLAAASTGPDGPPPLSGTHCHFPLAPYLHAALSETTPLDYDDADRGWAQVVEWQPQAASALSHWRPTRPAVHSRPGQGVLYVFVLVGPGPRKVSVAQLPSTAAMIVAEQLLRQLGGAHLPPTIRPLEISEVRATEHNLSAVGVQIDGQPAGQTAVLTDVGQLAEAASAAGRDRRVARALVRRALKKGTVHATGEALQADGALQLALLVAGTAWEATEQADTRHWALLPDQVQALRLELPAGPHRIALRPLAGQATTGQLPAEEIEIADGRNTYLLACFPSSQAVGQIVTSQP